MGTKFTRLETVSCMDTISGFKGTHPLKFGTKVRHKVTGVEGIVIAKFYLLSGCVTVYYTSQTETDRDKKPIKYYDTVDMVEVVAATSIFSKQPVEESVFCLGEKVKVPAYGFAEGVIHGIAFYPDQVSHVEIQPP